MFLKEFNQSLTSMVELARRIGPPEEITAANIAAMASPPAIGFISDAIAVIFLYPSRSGFRPYLETVKIPISPASGGMMDAITAPQKNVAGSFFLSFKALE
tara:strand:+ start:251 stop:553 length:303 start_codon:yes stop_codon:yes gene_type:complete